MVQCAVPAAPWAITDFRIGRSRPVARPSADSQDSCCPHFLPIHQEIHADGVVLDDARARHMVEGERCRIVGLLDLLLEGKRRGLISVVQPLLDHMQIAGSLSEKDSIQTFFSKAAKVLRMLRSSPRQHLP